ncbi:uncharacterized protein LOC115665891 [Syzygium oleosum]|uniref:uncharacterized protein LOC115665891 n=1 Tax=Syzygium oleosum TaxID=219896 RepID=UPI0011D213B1|nr:uncharacterized protein LOC115665891 [Syzygium oleosum]XP_030443652.1 uncharacterized protein LOC115665891 [Syzygium oleosum]XP_056164580.1 uncharacterized protein LOC115665891 [Syzygium oleosum]XP_056164581.1 uncharacterized protein LOC115665891 [Syzygium oleosum]XP_056164582.1 uncharacterized protein LOC115665891 [Syzygium oleosum]
MKIDGETVVQHQVHNHTAKSFQHNDDPMTTVEQKSDKDTMKGNLDDMKYNENVAAPVPIDVDSGVGFWPVPGLNNPEPDEDLAGSDKLTGKSSFASYTDSTGETELVKEDLDLFTDKSVTECEIDKSIPSHKENPFCEVKDICVDEGVPSHKATLSETDGNKGLHAYLPLEKDANSDLDALERSKNCSEDLVRADTTADKFVDELSKEKVVPSVQELASQNPDRESSDDIVDGMKPPSPMVSNDESVMACSNLSLVKTQESVKGSEEDAPPSPSSIIKESNDTTLVHDSRDNSEMDNRSPENRVATDPSPSERLECGDLVNELSYCSKVESGSITFSFNASAPESSDRGESSSNGNKEEREGQNVQRADGASDRRTDSSLGRHDFGESSFSVAGPVSGSITYSGPIAYSGSLSLRSDSSTTSARSFAFPVLQSEWNSSPVRMAKSDRRRLRKHKGWRERLLCCKF